MGKKAEFGTPKWLANKMKSKGLQKLRWYCQMCQKQCRDQNGFKCHMTSESHQRQLLLFADNSRRYLGEFSYEFEKCFLELLRRRYGTKRVKANAVYQEYIRDRHHMHMNATRWTSLSGFVRYLGRTGKVIADETEKGWFITYIDRDPETIARQEALARKEKLDKDDEERLMDFIERQVERAKEVTKEQTATYTELQRRSEEEKIKIPLVPVEKTKPSIAVPNIKSETQDTAGISEDCKEVRKEPDTCLTLMQNKQDIEEGKPIRDSKGETEVKEVKLEFKEPKKVLKQVKKPEKRRLAAHEELIREQEAAKDKKSRKDYWLTEGIVVKIISRSLGDKFYKKKGYVKEVVNKYAAKVCMLENEETVELDQEHLETVIPAEGRPVKVVNGAYRGCTAVLRSLDEKNFCVSIEILTGLTQGRIVNGVQYEDISKIHT